MEIAERVAEVLGGRTVLGQTVRTWADLDDLVRAGLPKRTLQQLARRLGGPGAPISPFVHSVVPPATFKRRRRLSAEESARTERLARVVARAELLWGNPTEARRFLQRVHPLLGGRAPIDVARTELGARRVEQLIDDIVHGLPL